MDISIIIPASDTNKYHDKGDLSRWGSTSLLEWKISQAKKIKKISEIYISTNSRKVREIAEYSDLKVIKRDNKNDLISMYKSSSEKVKSEYILWLNCTFPYLSEKTLNNFTNSFFKMKKRKFDSAFMYHLEHEYFFKGINPINFNLDKMLIERRMIVPLKKISNGATIFQKKNMIKNSNFGSHPFFKKINWLESLEIKNTKNIKSFQSILNCL